jgi:DNA-binding MarR family transcriptional regulator
MASIPASTIYLLKRAELAVRGCVEMALVDVALTPSHLFVLVLIESGEATSSAELARAMGVLPQSMTELIAPLDKRGLIARQPDPANNRILRAALTASGEQLLAKTIDIAIRLERELLEDLGVRDIQSFNRILTELTMRAETHSFHPKLRRLTKVAAAKPERATPRKPSRRRAANRG